MGLFEGEASFYCDNTLFSLTSVISDEEEESSTEEEESNAEDIKLRLGEKVHVPDKVSKETEAGAEISALVNYIQPVHFSSFKSAEGEFLILFICSSKQFCSALVSGLERNWIFRIIDF